MADDITLYGPDERPLSKAQYDGMGRLATAVASFEGPTLRTGSARWPAGATPRQDLSPMAALMSINPNLWPFDPGLPLSPIVSGGGVRWAPPAGYNVTYSPDKKIGIPNARLRLFADQCPGIRIVIEQLKREFNGIQKDIVPKDAKNDDLEKSPDRDMLREWLPHPDPDQDIDLEQWETQFMEDALVIGAPAIWRMHSYAGDFVGLRPIDAGLVSCYLTTRGTTPKPPTPAYAFAAFSLPYIDYTSDELVYRPMNSRTWTPYGFGPVEATISYVLLQIFRSIFYVNTYDQSDVPPGWVTLPKEWTPNQIIGFADEMAKRMGAEGPERHHVRYMPSDSRYQAVKQMPDWDYEFDEYLMRVFAWIVGVSAAPIVKQASIGKGTEGLAQEALAAGIRPYQVAVKRVIDRAIQSDEIGMTTEGERFPRGFGKKDYELGYVSEREENRAEKLTEIIQRQENGQVSVNDCKKEYGEDLLDEDEYPAANEPMFKTPTGWVLLRDMGRQPEAPGKPSTLAQDGSGGAGAASTPTAGDQTSLGPNGEVPDQAEKLAKARDRIADESSETGVQQDRAGLDFEAYVVGWLKSPDPEWRVALVDGKAYRRDVDIDFLGATNPYAPTGVGFLPDHTLAIDDRLTADEWPLFISHELSEAKSMAAGEEYQPAHEAANRQELDERMEGKAALRGELRKWRRKANADVRSGRPMRKFASDVIPSATRFWIERNLKLGKVASAFSKVKRADVKHWDTSERASDHVASGELLWAHILKVVGSEFAEQAIAHYKTVAKDDAAIELLYDISDDELAELGDWLALLFDAGVLDSADIVGGGKVAAAAFAKQRAATLLTHGSGETPLDTLRDLIRAALATAVESGTSLKDFETSLRELLSEDVRVRAALIARTESKNAYNHGAAENYREQGIKKLEIADGSGLGDICDEENGQVVTIDEFIARSDARHPNCTIAPIPVLEGIEEETA
jgi:Phage Mu protein F like protein